MTLNMDTIPQTKFVSGSGDELDFASVVMRIQHFMQDSDSEYEIQVGTDSQTGGDRTKFVTAIVVHKIGRGAIFFTRSQIAGKMHVLRDRIYTETTLSINCATALIEAFLENEILCNIAVHCDVGPHGKTRELIREITGYVTSSGFGCRIKPDGVAACTVADKFTKKIAG